MTLTEREKLVSDIATIIYAHILNYGDYEFQATLTNWIKFAEPKLPRAEIDSLARDVKARFKELEKKIPFWTRQAIDEAIGKN